jgi:hypothetical protein
MQVHRDFSAWAIVTISKNPWAITFGAVGNYPMASPWLRHWSSVAFFVDIQQK